MSARLINGPVVGPQAEQYANSCTCIGKTEKDSTREFVHHHVLFKNQDAKDTEMVGRCMVGRMHSSISLNISGQVFVNLPPGLQTINGTDK